LGELARRRGEIAERARTGTLTIEDVEGGTITVSNLGMFGIESATPLVTLPQAVIVFVGAMIDEPVVRDGSIEVRPVIRLSAACDHRVLDGATAARFMTALKRNLEAS
jgi:pyruvate dehydrogenase E2 component (dihydrolipoamide acetyltransferase)